jgi:hypothetical protein
MILLLQLLEGLLDPSVSPRVTRPTFSAQPTRRTEVSNGTWIAPTQERVIVPGKTFGESLTALAYPDGWDASKIVVNLDPAAIAIYKQSEETKKALRGL